MNILIVSIYYILISLFILQLFRTFFSGGAEGQGPKKKSFLYVFTTPCYASIVFKN
jgi:hypothetical protein